MSFQITHRRYNWHNFNTKCFLIYLSTSMLFKCYQNHEIIKLVELKHIYIHITGRKFVVGSKHCYYLRLRTQKFSEQGLSAQPRKYLGIKRRILQIIVILYSFEPMPWLGERNTTALTTTISTSLLYYPIISFTQLPSQYLFA